MSRVIIAPNLCPGIEIRQGKDVAWVTVTPTNRTGAHGKPIWKWAVIGVGKKDCGGEDLEGWGNAKEMLHAMLDFLAAAGDRDRTRLEPGGFPRGVVEWAYQNSDEIEMAALELEEEKD